MSMPWILSILSRIASHLNYYFYIHPYSYKISFSSSSTVPLFPNLPSSKLNIFRSFACYFPFQLLSILDAFLIQITSSITSSISHNALNSLVSLSYPPAMSHYWIYLLLSQLCLDLKSIINLLFTKIIFTD